MKALIIYYSHSGNTASVAHDFADILRNNYKVGVETEKLKYKKEQSSIIARLLYRFTHKFVELEPTTADISGFDVLVLGIPVVGGKPAAAMLRYLDLLNNTSKTKIIACYVYGFDINAKKCSNYVKSILAKNKQNFVVEIFVPWREVLDKETIKKKIHKSLKEIGVKGENVSNK